MLKILIVDDDEATSDSLLCSLIANDFAVDVARRGREGIAKATAGD
ncbi:DNA-binding response OmpR family regulator [Caballeronia udeis]|uniref:DNA-binding response OmpR family regulator n=1 Tax=Caballeronia udeis TaxID=1232866 RepID=A0ABW8MQV7_9BURK